MGAVNPAHKDIILLMIRAGKHVLCEKPLTMNVKQTKEVMEAARKAKVFVMEAVWSRYVQVGHLLHRLIKRDYTAHYV